MLTSKRGFTLIELSIVLVIIGLITGGVLAGRSLIETASLRKVAATYSEFDTALATFRLKYNCLAGDCATAAAFGLGTSGNGNGIIGGSQVADANETRYYVLEHIKNASLFREYQTSTYNQRSFFSASLSNSAFFVVESASDLANSGATLILAGSLQECSGMCPPAGSLVYSPSLRPSFLLYIDQKADDGFPDAGRILASGSTFAMAELTRADNTPSAGARDDGSSCITNTTVREYNNLTSNQGLCAAIYIIK